MTRGDDVLAITNTAYAWVGIGRELLRAAGYIRLAANGEAAQQTVSTLEVLACAIHTQAIEHCGPDAIP